MYEMEQRKIRKLLGAIFGHSEPVCAVHRKICRFRSVPGQIANMLF